MSIGFESFGSNAINGTFASKSRSTLSLFQQLQTDFDSERIFLVEVDYDFQPWDSVAVMIASSTVTVEDTVSYDNNTIFAITNTGRFIKTTDAAYTWSAISSTPLITGEGVSYHNGIFVVVGQASSGKNIAYSNDEGSTWTQAASVESTRKVSTITYSSAHSLWVAGTTGTIPEFVRSSTLVDWFAQASSPVVSEPKKIVVNSLGTFIAANGLWNRIARSTDGISWKLYYLPGIDLINNILYLESEAIWVIPTDIGGLSIVFFSEDDGITWTRTDVDFTDFLTINLKPIKGVGFVNNRVVALSTNSVYWSVDGKNYTGRYNNIRSGGTGWFGGFHYNAEADAYTYIGRTVKTAISKRYPYLSFSTKRYVADDESNRTYLPRVDNPGNLELSLYKNNTFIGEVAVDPGIVVINNSDGFYDTYANTDFEDSRIVVKMGKEDFSYNDFGVVQKSSVEALEFDDTRIIFKVKSQKALLERLVHKNHYSSAEGANIAGRPKPLCYGECHNITPTLIDTASSIYQVHDGQIQSIDTVYFAGATATTTAYTVNTSAGTFELSTNPLGEVTCDVKGDKSPGYIDTPSGILRRVLGNKIGLVDADIDFTSIAYVSARKTDTMGIYLSESGATILNVIDKIAQTIGGYWGANRQGKIFLGILTPPGTPIKTIETKDILAIKRLKAEELFSLLHVHYDKNWTVQNRTDLAAVVAEDRVQYLEREYRVEIDEPVSAKLFNFSIKEKHVETLLVDASAAVSLKQDILNTYFPGFKFNNTSLKYDDHVLYNVKIGTLSFDFILGDTITLKHNRLGLDDGVDMVVVGFREDIKTNTTNLVLWN